MKSGLFDKETLIQIKEEIVLTCKGFGIPENEIPKETVIFLKNHVDLLEKDKPTMLTYGSVIDMIDSHQQ